MTYLRMTRPLGPVASMDGPQGHDCYPWAPTASVCDTPYHSLLQDRGQTL